MRSHLQQMPLQHDETRRGFALVLALSMMAFVLMVVLAMSTLVTVELKSSRNEIEKNAARANARMALMMALGDLQKYAGPDQRVTANGAILRPVGSGSQPAENSKWTGVWSTTKIDEPENTIVGGGADANFEGLDYLSDARNDDDFMPLGDQEKLRLAWLVSGDVPANSTPGYDSSYITLVENSAGLSGASDADPDFKRVSAPYVKLSNANGADRGGYAYWIGDESQKARINEKSSDKDPSLTTPMDGGIASLYGSNGAKIGKVMSDEDQPYMPIEELSAEQNSKLITANTVAIPLSSQSAIKHNFHDLTTYSSSVLADSREGGLKKDLTAYINSGAAPPAPLTIGGTTIPETGLADLDASFSGRPMLPAPLYRKYGPDFLQLKNWYNLRKQVELTSSQSRIEPQFMTSRASTLGLGDLPDLKSRSQAVHPVIAEARLSFDISMDNSRPQPDGRGPALRTHVYPMVKLWNPYNVTIKAHNYIIGLPRDIETSVFTKTLRRIDNHNAGPRQDDYYGTLIGPYLYFKLAAVDIPPGECLTFSAQTSSPSDPYDTTDIAANVLSSKIPYGTQDFYFDSNIHILETVDPTTRLDYRIRTSIDLSRACRPYVLKSLGSSATTTSVDTAQTLPIIQRLAMDISGDGNSLVWGWARGALPNPGGRSDGAPALPDGLLTSSAHENAEPRNSWYMGARLRRMEENPNELTNGYSGHMGQFVMTSPPLSYFNMRSPIVTHNNFDMLYDWVWWHVGPYINSRTDPTITDASMASNLDPSTGNYYSSPFGITNEYGSTKSYAIF